MTKKRDWGETFYSGEAAFGKIHAVIGAVVSTFIGIILTIIGILLIVHKTHLKKIQGAVVGASQCNGSQTCDDKNNCHKVYTCTTPVEYIINGRDYKRDLSTGSTSYKKGDKISFYYNPSDPAVIESAPAPSWLGWALVAMALVLLFSSWAWVYVTRKSKAAAAAGGAAATVGLFRDAIR